MNEAFLMSRRHLDARILIGELGSGERGRYTGCTRINETH